MSDQNAVEVKNKIHFSLLDQPLTQVIFSTKEQRSLFLNENENIEYANEITISIVITTE